MSDKGIEWLEANINNAAKGLNLIIAKMLDQLRDPERLAMVLLLRDGRKHISELKDELSLSRQLVTHHAKVLEKWGIVSYDDPKDYAAELVRYVELTTM